MPRTGTDRQGERPARGRPREFDRDRAVRAALETFWTRGFERSTATELADAMSIQRSSFYNSFGDREALFREALDTYAATAPDAAFAALRPGEPVAPLVRRVLRRLCRLRAADPGHRGCLMVNSIGELVGVHPELGPRVEQFVTRGLSVYERLVSQAIDQGELPDRGDRRAAAAAFMAFVSGLNLLARVVREERALWRICRQFLEGFGFGSGTPAGRKG